MAVPQEYLDDPWLTVKDVMKILNYKKTRAYRIMTEIPHIRDGRLIRVRKSALDDWTRGHIVNPF